MHTRLDKTPYAINLLYILGTGLLLLLAPELMRSLFAVAAETPLYIGRMMGSLTLALGAILAFAMQQGNRPLLGRLGLIQSVVGVLFALSILIDGAPATFWVIVLLNLVLGIWMIMAARSPIKALSPRSGR